jgi:hypothetical protein
MLCDCVTCAAFWIIRFGIDFNFYKMEKKDFFKHYILALEKALDYTKNVDFEFCGPDRFIEDEVIRNDLDNFENENYQEFETLFNGVSLYFDATSHNFKEIDGISIEEYKKQIVYEISKIKNLYP